MHKYDREKDRLIIKLEAAEKAYMSLLYDYTELKEQKETMEKAFKEVRDLLDYLINHNYASKDKSEEKENGYWSVTDRPYQRPKWWISQWPTAIWPFVWDYPYSPDWYPTTTTFTLCSTRECRSVKLPSTDDTNDVTAKWNDENDGWKDEEAWRESKTCCWRRGRKEARGCCSAEWR